MPETIYRHSSGSGTLLLRKTNEGRWSLTIDNSEVCSYLSPEKAAHFVARGSTGDSRIDFMKERPKTLFDWQR